MINKTNIYFAKCQHCGEAAEFKVDDIDPLMDDIEDACFEARRSERVDVECEYFGFIDPDNHHVNGRVIRDLAAAIHRGDADDALRLLESIADELGKRNDFETGWFSPESKGLI